MRVPVKRADFSQGLVHLTRDRLQNLEDEIDAASPFEVLKEILASGVIRGSGNSGYVKGALPAACFSEIPLSAVHQFASPPNVPFGPSVRYRFYGIAISKKACFAAGGRPVIYLPDSETDWIPADQKWRVVRFEHGLVDFTHEREWRVRGDLQLAKLPGMYLLVWSASEASEVAAMNFEVKALVRGILPMEHLTQLL